MPWTRQLDSGLWASTVRTPVGRITQTHRLKSVIEDWADDIESDVRRGDFIDPRLAEITVGECWERFKDAKRRELASRKRDESHWRVHVQPRWGDVPIGSILKPDVSAWVVAMETAHKQNCSDPKRCPGCKVGAATIEGALKVLRGLLETAVDARLIRFNPALKVARPPVPPSVPRILDAQESALLFARLRELFDDRVDGELFVELLYETGMRWEEAAAIPPDVIDTRRQRIQVAWVMERSGRARGYAKSEKGNRTVTYGDHLAARITAAKLAARPVSGMYPDGGPTRAVFTSPEGKPLHYSNWLHRVWSPGLLAAPTEPATKQPGRRGPAPKPKGEPYLVDPQPTPHDLRHSYGTELANEGVPQHEIMDLMGHKDRRASDGYIHAGEERFDRSRRALDRARGRATGAEKTGS